MGCRGLLLGFLNLNIRLWKWIEFQFLRCFRPLVTRIILDAIAPTGVVIERVSTSPNSNNNNAIARQTQIIEMDTLVGDNRKSNSSKYGRPIRVKVHDPDGTFFLKVANRFGLALGEAYMDGTFQVSDESELIEVAYRFWREDLLLLYYIKWNRLLDYLSLRLFNLQTERKAWEVGRKHYDLGNDLFRSFLDPYMNYSCGYWANADNLDDAQLAKMDLIARKLQLEPGMKVLDIGCGWGGLCKYLAEKYQVSCVGVTISAEGVKFGREFCKGLPVDLRLADYRSLTEKFDRIVSVGMFEHVGTSNYREYFKVAHRCLKDDGLFLLHTIGINHKDMIRIEPFTHTYIFPNGCLPKPEDITRTTGGLFFIEDWHNLGADYAKTLEAWLGNFKRNWGSIEDQYGERFYKLWTYYLAVSSGGFKARRFNVWQIVLSKDGLTGGYRAAR